MWADLWGAWGRGGAHRLGCAMPCWGSGLPFPLKGAMKEALCARPLPWPVRPSGCGMKRLFRRASALPAPGNRSRGGAARGRTHNAPLCRAPGAARQCPHPGCTRLGRAGCSPLEVGGEGQDAPRALRMDIPGWGNHCLCCPHSRCPHSRCPELSPVHPPSVADCPDRSGFPRGAGA